jgi:hypothetical protein
MITPANSIRLDQSADSASQGLVRPSVSLLCRRGLKNGQKNPCPLWNAGSAGVGCAAEVVDTAEVCSVGATVMPRVEAMNRSQAATWLAA